jgi:hypothetical protein
MSKKPYCTLVADEIARVNFVKYKYTKRTMCNPFKANLTHKSSFVLWMPVTIFHSAVVKYDL